MSRLVVLGIDAGNPELLRRWSADGSLPNLQRLTESGVSGPVAGLNGFFIGSTWPTLYTGVSPARHGLHYLTQLVPGTYELRSMAERGLVQRDAFWTLASREGRRVAVLDVPLTRLEPDLNGIQTVEWGGHDAVYGFKTHPEELGADLIPKFGLHPVGTVCDGLRSTAEDYRTFVDGLVLGVERKTALTLELQAREDWDLLVQVFTEAHCCGHQCWHLHDASHPGHDPDVTEQLGNPLNRVYRAIDTAIGEILREVGDATVVVLSAHGMAHWFGAQFLLPDILERLGVMTPLPTREAGLRDRCLKAAVSVWKRVPGPIRAALGPVRDRFMERAIPAPAPPKLQADAPSSLCFPVNNGLAVGGIRLNLAGREPEGRLQPGADVDRFCAELEADLLEIIDKRTGGPLIRRVIRTAREYHGPYLDHLPDLLVEWSDDAPTGSTMVAGGAGATVEAHSPKIGVVRGVNEYGRTGENRGGGFFWASGPGLAESESHPGVALVDFAPTFARILGLPSQDWDGRPIDAMVPGPDLGARP